MFQWLRIKTVMPHIRGRLLDVGCGNNKLVKKYGNGVGIDKNDPRPKDNFDTISFVASLNYMTREDLDWLGLHLESYLKKDGQVIIACRHVLQGFSKESVERAFTKSVRGVQLYLAYYRPFMFGLNGLYVFRRRI